MKKLMVFILNLFFLSVIYAEVDQALFMKISGRVNELRDIMEEKLFEADIYTDVIVAYELKEDKVVFKAKTIPLEDGKVYQIQEERYINNFVETAKAEYIFPVIEKPKPVIGWKFTSIMLLALLFAGIGVKTKKRKKNLQEKEKETEKRKAA